LAAPTIVIDVGMVRTSFILFAGGSMVFTKSLAVGGRDFEAAIAKELRISPDQARQVKIDVGLSRDAEGGAVYRALEPHVRAIADELEQQMLFYREHTERKHAALGELGRVLLCGGDANLIGLAKYLGSAIKRAVLVADPFVNLRLPVGAIPPVPKNQSLKYTTAIGLALRALGR
jgi:type IV pilus assembly protein PilM